MSDNLKSKSTETSQKRKRQKLFYPSWRSLATNNLMMHFQKYPEHFAEKKYDLKKFFDQLEPVHSAVGGDLICNIPLFCNRNSAVYSGALQTSKVHKTTPAVQGEFQLTIDDNGNVTIHSDASTSLGLSAGFLEQKWNQCGSDSLFHPKDQFHLQRWFSIAYYLLSLNLFDWKAVNCRLRIRARLKTKQSDLSFSKNEYVGVERTCALHVSEDGSRPLLQSEQCQIIPYGEFHYVEVGWIASPEVQEYLTDFTYLINAYLIRIPVAQILMLEAKAKLERYKAIARKMNSRIEMYAGFEAGLDEHQIADAFGKTIRKRMSEAINQWDFRFKDNGVNISSDSEAVHYAKKLGLLPMPRNIKRLAFRNIMPADQAN